MTPLQIQYIPPLFIDSFNFISWYWEQAMNTRKAREQAKMRGNLFHKKLLATFIQAMLCELQSKKEETDYQRQSIWS